MEKAPHEEPRDLRSFEIGRPSSCQPSVQEGSENESKQDDAPDLPSGGLTLCRRSGFDPMDGIERDSCALCFVSKRGCHMPKVGLVRAIRHAAAFGAGFTTGDCRGIHETAFADRRLDAR